MKKIQNLDTIWSSRNKSGYNLEVNTGKTIFPGYIYVHMSLVPPKGVYDLDNPIGLDKSIDDTRETVFFLLE